MKQRIIKDIATYNDLIYFRSELLLDLSWSFQVPREKRYTPSAIKPTEPSAHGHSNCRKLDMVGHQLQAMVSLPVNLSLNNSTTTEHQQGHKYGPESHAGDSREDGKGGENGPLALVKTESQAPMPLSFSGGTCQKEPRDQIRRLYEQSYDMSLTGYLKDEQRSSLDGTCEEPVEKEVSPNLNRIVGCCYTSFVDKIFFLFDTNSFFSLLFLFTWIVCSLVSSFTDVPQKFFLGSRWISPQSTSVSLKTWRYYKKIRIIFMCTHLILREEWLNFRWF